MSNIGAKHQEVTTIPDIDGTGPQWLIQKQYSCHGGMNFSEAYTLKEDEVNLTELVKRTGRSKLTQSGRHI